MIAIAIAIIIIVSAFVNNSLYDKSLHVLI